MYLDLTSVFLLYPEVSKRIAGGAGGSMKMSYNLLPARAVSCEMDYLLVLADLFCKSEKTTLSRLLFRNYSPLLSLLVYLGG